MDNASRLLPKLKANLILQHDQDDELLLGCLAAALDYAAGYQKTVYDRRSLPPGTEQAVIMLATHFYESRDGGTGGFFTDTAPAAAHVWQSVNRLLAMGKEWCV
jgi:hypothetical protein